MELKMYKNLIIISLIHIILNAYNTYVVMCYAINIIMVNL